MSDSILAALRELVARCDGDEGARADGSNIDTSRAHAAIARAEGPLHLVVDCDACYGTGWRQSAGCPECRGTGRVKRPVHRKIAIIERKS